MVMTNHVHSVMYITCLLPLILSLYTIYDVWCMLFHISVTAEGKKIPTELKAEASQLRKKMKFDDTEREGMLYVLCT